MVKIVSESDEKRKISNSLFELEQLAKEMFPDFETRNIPLSQHWNNGENTLAVYSKGITSIPAYSENEVIADFTLGYPRFIINNKKAYDDALRLAQAYENKSGVEVRLITP